MYPYFLTFISGRNSEGNYSFSRDVLLFICTYKLFAGSSQFEGENKVNMMTVLWLLLLLSVFCFCLFVCCP